MSSSVSDAYRMKIVITCEFVACEQALLFGRACSQASEFEENILSSTWISDNSVSGNKALGKNTLSERR